MSSTCIDLLAAVLRLSGGVTDMRGVYIEKFEEDLTV